MSAGADVLGMGAALIGVVGGVITVLLTRIPALSPRGAKRSQLKRDLELVHLAEPGPGRDALARSLDGELAAMAARTGVWAPWTAKRVGALLVALALLALGVVLILVPNDDVPSSVIQVVLSFSTTVAALAAGQAATSLALTARRARAKAAAQRRAHADAVAASRSGE